MFRCLKSQQTEASAGLVAKAGIIRTELYTTRTFTFLKNSHCSLGLLLCECGDVTGNIFFLIPFFHSICDRVCFVSVSGHENSLMLAFPSAGGKEGSKSNCHRPHFWLLRCVQSNWIPNHGEICEYMQWSCIGFMCKMSCADLMSSPLSPRQIVQIGAKFMLVMGIFVSSICTILFG